MTEERQHSWPLIVLVGIIAVLFVIGSVVIGVDHFNDRIDAKAKEVAEQKDPAIAVLAAGYEQLRLDYQARTQTTLPPAEALVTAVAGTPGLQGVQGFPGTTGLQGIQGVQGLAGIMGLTGLTGPQGEPGAPGQPGSTGISGASGTNGLNGVNGTDGAPGLQGVQGSVGPPGPAPTSFTFVFLATTYTCTDPNADGAYECVAA